MADLNLELNIYSAKDLENVNFITKMDIYAIVWINGDDSQKSHKEKTPVDRTGGYEPTWNHVVKFSVNQRLAREGCLTLVVKLVCERMLGDKDLGEVQVPVLELLDSSSPPFNRNADDQGMMRFVTYQVRTPSGKGQGSLTFSYRFNSQSFKPDLPMGSSSGYPNPIDSSSNFSPSTTYPPSSTSHPPSSTTYPPSPTTYPPSSTTYTPSSTTYPPSSTSHPPSSTTYPPSPTTYPPSSTAYPPSPMTYPPSSTAYPSRTETYPPSSESSLYPSLASIGYSTPPSSQPQGYSAPPYPYPYHYNSSYSVQPIAIYPPLSPSASNIYPPPSHTTSPSPHHLYPPPSDNSYHQTQPPQSIHGYVQSPPHHHHYGHSYPPPPSSYGYGCPRTQAPPKKDKAGLGVGAGLLGGALGGLIIGDMVSDMGFDF